MAWQMARKSKKKEGDEISAKRKKKEIKTNVDRCDGSEVGELISLAKVKRGGVSCEALDVQYELGIRESHKMTLLAQLPQLRTKRKLTGGNEKGNNTVSLGAGGRVMNLVVWRRKETVEKWRENSRKERRKMDFGKPGGSWG
jgi:hypothetical protein